MRHPETCPHCKRWRLLEKRQYVVVAFTPLPKDRRYRATHEVCQFCPENQPKSQRQ